MEAPAGYLMFSPLLPDVARPWVPQPPFLVLFTLTTPLQVFPLFTALPLNPLNGNLVLPQP